MTTPSTNRAWVLLARIWRSLYWQISIVFLCVLFAAAGAQYLAFWYSELRYDILGDQILNWTVADSILAEIEPDLGPPLNREAVQRKFARAVSLNPGLEPHLLDENGSSLLSLGPDHDRPKVDTAAIERFLTIRGHPSTAITTRSPNFLLKAPAIFSAARVPSGKTGTYLFVQLNGSERELVHSMMREYFALRLTAFTIPLIVGSSALLGLLLFRRVTRRFSHLSRAVERFEGGDLSERVPAGGRDEISALTQSFNRMADTISRNIEELKNTDALRRELVANVSHDLRKPLTVMQASLDGCIVRDEVQSPEERKRAIELAARNCARLSALIDDLFDLSKLNTIVKPVFAELSLAALASEIAGRFQPMGERKSITLEAIGEAGLPSVSADAGLLDRAVSNLVDNAIRYTPSGGSVRIEVRGEGERVQMSVSDTGTGIPPSDLEHIFKRAYRSSLGREMEEDGSGLGLEIAHRIIELHGAPLLVESEVGKGSRFFFALAEVSKNPEGK